MEQKSVTKISAVLFGLIALLHLVRLVLQWPANIAGWDVPLWISVVPVFIAGYLAYKNWMAGK